MKHKGVKIVLAAAIAALAVGGICLGAGVALGGSPSFYCDEDGIHVKEDKDAARRTDYRMESTAIAALQNLEIDLFEADLEIVSGKDWSVEYVLSGYRQEPEYSLDGQTLTIRENRNQKSNSRRTFGVGDYWWYDGESDVSSPYVKITVPDSAKLISVTVDSEYGNVSIERNLRAQSVSVNAQYGDVTLDGWEGDLLSFEMNSGSLATGTLDGKNLAVSNQNGPVRIGSLKTKTADFQMEYGDLSVSVSEVGSVEVENQGGSVTLGLLGGMEAYGVSLHTDLGTIRTPMGIVEADEYEGSSDFIRMEGEAAGIRVYTEYGDIRIKDEA